MREHHACMYPDCKIWIEKDDKTKSFAISSNMMQMCLQYCVLCTDIIRVSACSMERAMLCNEHDARVMSAYVKGKNQLIKGEREEREVGKGCYRANPMNGETGIYYWVVYLNHSKHS